MIVITTRATRATTTTATVVLCRHSSRTRVEKGAGPALRLLVIGALVGIANSHGRDGVGGVGGSSVARDARHEAAVQRTGECCGRPKRVSIL